MLLSIEALKVSINNTPVLHDVHMSLKEGEIHGFLGPNGAGKSTTINTVLGLLKSDSGHIEVFGNTAIGGAAGAKIREQIGVLPEQNGFYDWMEATDYLEFFARLYGRAISRQDIRLRLNRVGLEPKDGQTITMFSRGMKQRLGLARALIANPRLIILDEPTNGLDPRGRRDIHDILSSLAAEGAGILLCTHLLDDVERLCSSVGIIVEGRTVIEGPVADLLRDRGHQNRFKIRMAVPPSAEEQSKIADNVSVLGHDDDWWLLQFDAGTSSETVWRELFFRGWKITEIRQEGGGIEEMYLSLTDGRSI